MPLHSLLLLCAQGVRLFALDLLHCLANKLGRGWEDRRRRKLRGDLFGLNSSVTAGTKEGCHNYSFKAQSPVPVVGGKKTIIQRFLRSFFIF